MQAPDGRIAALAGFVIGLAICGLTLATPSSDPVTVQLIELDGSGTVPTAQPMSPTETEPMGPWLPGGGFPSQTPGPEPAITPTVVAPPVVVERPTAPPRATPRPTKDDDDDDADDEPDDDDDADDADEPEEPED